MLSFFQNMRNTLVYLLGTVLLLAGASACQNTAKDPAQPVTIGSKNYNRTEGAGCDQPEEVRTNCATVDLEWPVVEQGPDDLKTSVAAWVAAYFAGILAPESDAASNATIEASVAAFFKEQKTFAQEAPDSPAGNFMAESKFSVLLNNGKYLTLELEGYTYTGGAHGSPTAAVATFEVATGKQLTWKELVTDTAALRALAEKAFRAERSDLFASKDGSEPVEFGDIFPFVLPQNYGLTSEGIYCHYVVYEVGPYAIGSTQLTLPFETLGNLSKVQPPADPIGDAEELPAMYQRQGSSIVLPTFEIEVANSPKSGQTLSKQQETIIVSAYFSGTPKDDRDRDEVGEMLVAKQEIELSGNERLARFEGIKFPKRLYDKLADKDVLLLINVYSGRRSSENNLLDCGFLQAHASQFQNKRYVLGCKLIGENAQLPTQGNDPIACYALPEPGAAPDQKPALVVTCNEAGQIEWAGRPQKDYAALKATLRPVLAYLLKNGAKELPDLQTEGCTMGNSGEIRTMYEELKAELLGKASGSK